MGSGEKAQGRIGFGFLIKRRKGIVVEKEGSVKGVGSVT